MTDEEKTEEYVNNKGFGSDYNNIDSNEANEKIRQAHLDGLAEGRNLMIEQIKDGTIYQNLQEEIAELKTELQNYADVINRLMGTQLTDTFEIGRLIAIAQYRNWEKL